MWWLSWKVPSFKKCFFQITVCFDYYILCYYLEKNNKYASQTMIAFRGPCTTGWGTKKTLYLSITILFFMLCPCLTRHVWFLINPLGFPQKKYSAIKRKNWTEYSQIMIFSERASYSKWGLLVVPGLTKLKLVTSLWIQKSNSVVKLFKNGLSLHYYSH